VSTAQAEQCIEAKRIGDRIKYLRQRKQMGLVELGRHTGLSASFLSQLKTGRVVPTLRNLARIAMVFSKNMSYLFETLGAVPMDKRITPYLAELLPASEGRVPRSHQHPGTESVYPERLPKTDPRQPRRHLRML